jgi:hypothetical protein
MRDGSELVFLSTETSKAQVTSCPLPPKIFWNLISFRLDCFSIFRREYHNIALTRTLIRQLTITFFCTHAWTWLKFH